ncbi:transmembrane protease serine 9-like [Armigeres subalbatus]|uniref:transmembrane protease serine 9-like n=1 Tax=Armigeres subalbatus TaxID=124917 RepID=UPI002ED6BFBB
MRATFTLVELLFLLFPLPSALSIQVKSDQHRYACGRRPINGVGVITSGQSTWPGQFPWHAALFRTKGLGSEYICGGFIVTDRIVLTAAHCATATNGYQIAPSSVSVRLGLFELLSMTKNTQEHRVERIYRHHDYNASSYRHDIALLLLRTILEFNDYVQPICLWEDGKYGPGDNLVGIVSGWGITEYDMLADELKSARLPMVSVLECLESDRDLFSQAIFDGMFCAGLTNTTNVCNGDSGGAFAIDINGTWAARGIVSFTGLRDSSVTLCKAESLAGFVNIPRYVGWIERMVNKDRFLPIESSSDNSDEKSYSRPNSAVTPTTTTSSISISEKKCVQYHNKSKTKFQELSYLAYVSEGSPFMRKIDCFAVLISERFLLAKADCYSPLASHSTKSGPKQFVIVESEGRALQYRIEGFHRHPSYSHNPSENNLALIELNRDVSLPSSQFVCLWSRGELDLGKIFLYSAMTDSGRPPSTDSSVKCFNQLLAPSIMIERDYYHLVGIVINSTCTTIRFIKLPKFVPWIESIVWKRD